MNAWRTETVYNARNAKLATGTTQVVVINAIVTKKAHWPRSATHSTLNVYAKTTHTAIDANTANQVHLTWTNVTRKDVHHVSALVKQLNV